MKSPRQIAASLAGLVSRQRDVAAEFAQALQAVRLDLAAAQSELANVRRAPPDAAELRARATEVVDILASQAREALHADMLNRPDFNCTHIVDGFGRLAGSVIGEAVAGGAGAFAGTAMLNMRLSAGHMAALMRPAELISLLIDEASKGSTATLPALSADRRSAEVARLTAIVAEHERAEEALCRAGESNGLTEVQRRPDADPRWLIAPDAALASSASQ